VQRLSTALVAAAQTLDPIVRKERTRGAARKLSDRNFATGFCWSFAEGVGLWMRHGKPVAVWEEDWEGGMGPSHVAWRAPSGLVLDSLGAYEESVFLARTLERHWEDAAVDVRAWIVGDASAFELRKHGIFPPRKHLVELVAMTMNTFAPSASFECLRRGT